tara:strand:- start:335 stop:1147 length:813 start_codon:yes stop_codon:yes gene_type:complete
MGNHLNLHLLTEKPKATNKVLVAIHGVGQTGDICFLEFSKTVADVYNVFVLDLYFHGVHARNEFVSSKNYISKDQWQSDFEEQLHARGIESFDILGFSMGARFAMASVSLFADRIGTAFLVAPDGIAKRPLYSLVTRFSPFRFVFKKIMASEKFLFGLFNLASKLRLISRSLLKFTTQVATTEANRFTVYNSWVAFRNLNFDVLEWYQYVKKHSITLYLVVGEFDQLLKPQHVRKLQKLLSESHFLVLPTGHTGLIRKLGNRISDIKSAP